MARMRDSSRRYVMTAAEASLRRLTRLDLLYDSLAGLRHADGGKL